MNNTTTVFALDMDGSMEPHEGGEWVHADDYFALEQEKELLVDQLRKLAVENAALRAESLRFREDALNEKAARRALESALTNRKETP